MTHDSRTCGTPHKAAPFHILAPPRPAAPTLHLPIHITHHPHHSPPAYPHHSPPADTHHPAPRPCSRAPTHLLLTQLTALSPLAPTHLLLTQLTALSPFPASLMDDRGWGAVAGDCGSSPHSSPSSCPPAPTDPADPAIADATAFPEAAPSWASGCPCCIVVVLLLLSGSSRTSTNSMKGACKQAVAGSSRQWLVEARRWVSYPFPPSPLTTHPPQYHLSDHHPSQGHPSPHPPTHQAPLTHPPHPPTHPAPPTQSPSTTHPPTFSREFRSTASLAANLSTRSCLWPEPIGNQMATSRRAAASISRLMASRPCFSAR